MLSQNPSSSHRLLVFFIQLIVFIVLMFLLNIYHYVTFSDEQLIYPLSLIISFILLWVLFSARFMFGGFLNPYVLFIMAAIVFNGGQIFLEALQLNEKGFLNGIFPPSVVLRTMFITVLGISVFHLGGTIVAATMKQSQADIVEGINITTIRFVAWSFFILSVYPTLSKLINYTNLVLTGGYLSLYQQQREIGILSNLDVGLADLFITSLLLMVVCGKRYKLDLWVSAVFIILYSLLNLSYGARAGGVLPLVAYTWLYHRTIKPLPKTLLIGVSSIFLFIVFPVLRVIREFTGMSRLSLQFIVDSYFSVKNPIVSILSELGQTADTIAYTIDLVPRIKNFDFGLGYFYAIRFITPNSIWSTQPEYPTAGEWLIWTVEPETAQLGGAKGYSFIAESYLNFGWFGIILLFVFGVLLSRLVFWSEKSYDLAKFAFLACLLNQILFFARAESIAITRSFFWYTFIPYIILMIFNRIKIDKDRGER